MRPSIKVVLGSLVGALAVHGALSACGGSRSANASPSSCATWQVLETSSASPSAPEPPMVLAPGWEPFAVDPVGNVFMRQCAP